VPRCGRNLLPPSSFHHQKNSSTSKIWQLMEQRQNQKNLPANAKVGLDERKRKGAKVWQEFASNKIWRQDTKF
jgi:hypothetical protein